MRMRVVVWRGESGFRGWWWSAGEGCGLLSDRSGLLGAVLGVFCVQGQESGGVS